ncbi:MAG: nodulation protein NfeD [Candidatus Rokubacteria bacterium]|nr:nodulation protein NfeD [Candidatus Rokubacteria bacterium]
MKPFSGLAPLLFLAALAAFAASAGSAQGSTPVVYVLPVDGVIDLGLAPFTRRILDEATAAGAAAVILRVNTLGGRVDAAILMRDDLLRAKVKTVAFVDKRAISAGALISLAAERIVMAPGSTIGAATPVEIGQPGAPAKPVAEKTVSYMRKEFRATAESRGRPPLVAEGMVDPDVEIRGVIAKGKLLTLTTDEALKLKVADARADDLAQVLAQLGLGNAEVRQTRPNWAEEIVRFLTHPVLSSLLMTIGIFGIIIELRAPGFGLPGILGIASLGLFFWGHWLVRLAGWEEVLLVTLGLLLLALEIFVIPGFGVAGVLGLGALLAGFVRSLVGTGATWETVAFAGGRVLLSFALAVIGAIALLPLLPRLPGGRRLVLRTELGAGEGFASPPVQDRDWLGKRGAAVSPLRPAGIADLEGERVDVVSDGEFIEPGAAIVVVRVDGNRVVVRRTQTMTSPPA